MQSAKIQLSPEHIKLVTNANWILTKNEILANIKKAFEELYNWQQDAIKQHDLPAELLQSGGKISRGENYLGLPWIVLDSPRHFVKGNVFAIRTLFWWGQFFSTTLHLSGKWQQKMIPYLANAFNSLSLNNLKICFGGDEWVHDVNNTSYLPLKEFDQQEFEKIMQEAPFIKIVACTPIENVENAIEILMQQFQLFLKIIAA